MSETISRVKSVNPHELAFTKAFNAADVIHVVQLTDTHLYADPSQTLLGINTLDSLRAVIGQVAKHDDKPDVLLGTGDMTHNGSVTAYRRLAQEIASLALPMHCIAGNHDLSDVMRAELQGPEIYYCQEIALGSWLIIMLDSTIAGEEGGAIRQSELDRLQARLQKNTHPNVLIVLHHQPVPVGSAWLDTMQVNNSDEFFALIDQFTAVKGILWGHIHQNFESERNGVKLFGSPSTCVQFAPNQENFKVDDLAPGYRRIKLHPEGMILSKVLRLESFSAQVDLASAGY